MNEIRQKHPPVRESSQGTLTAYYGTFGGLAGELESGDPKQRIRTYSETGNDEVIYAARVLGSIANSVTIINGPSGCGAAKLEDYLRGGSSPFIVTNIDENDSILGGDDKLRKAIGDAYRLYNPALIFVIATPVIAINNDDILSVVTEWSDTLGIPVVPVFAAGFKSKAAVYGYDLAYHAIAKYVWSKNIRVPSDFINLIGTAGAGSAHILKDLQESGIRINNLTGQSIELDALLQAVNAKASIALDHDDAYYLQRVLEELYGVASLNPSAPIGIRNTERWLLAAGEAAGSKETAKAYVLRAQNVLQPLLNSKPLADKKVFIDLPPEQAFSLTDLIEELGGEPSAIAVEQAGKLQADRIRSLQDRWKDIPVLVQPGQPFEKINMMGKLRNDLYIGRSENAVWAAKAGIPAVAADGLDLYGFGGAGIIADAAAKALQNTALSRYLSGSGGLSSYHESWLKKTTNWHIKVEVK